MSSGLRLDKWLWFSRLAKSRNRAAGWCEEGRVLVNGIVMRKPSHMVRPGDVLVVPVGGERDERWRAVRVTGLAERRGPFIDARLLYDEMALPIGALATLERAGYLCGENRP